MNICCLDHRSQLIFFLVFFSFVSLHFLQLLFTGCVNCQVTPYCKSLVDCNFPHYLLQFVLDDYFRHLGGISLIVSWHIQSIDSGLVTFCCFGAPSTRGILRYKP